MLDEDELAAEHRMWRAGAGGGGKGKEELDEEGDYDPRPAFRAPQAKAKAAKSRVVLLEEEEDDDQDDARSVRRRPRGDDNTLVASSQISAGARPVPWRVQEAAMLVVEYREAKLSQRVQQELTLHILQHPHEFYSEDPLVVLWTSVDTGTARVYCKDVVPVSFHLLALAFNATFQLQLTAKVRTAAQAWAEAVHIRPCRSEQGTAGERWQPLGTAAAVQHALERADLELAQVEARTQRYMATLGRLDTRDVCDPDWLEQHTKGLRQTCLSTDSAQDDQGIKAKLRRIAGSAKGGDDL